MYKYRAEQQQLLNHTIKCALYHYQQSKITTTQNSFEHHDDCKEAYIKQAKQINADIKFWNVGPICNPTGPYQCK